MKPEFPWHLNQGKANYTLGKFTLKEKEIFLRLEKYFLSDGMITRFGFGMIYQKYVKSQKLTQYFRLT